MYEDSLNTNFQGKKIPKENASCKCLSLIALDFVIRANKKYYPQTLLEECNYEIRRIKWRILLMMIYIQVHLMNLIMRLIMRLMINFDNGSDNDESSDSFLKKIR